MRPFDKTKMDAFITNGWEIDCPACGVGHMRPLNFLWECTDSNFYPKIYPGCGFRFRIIRNFNPRSVRLEIL